MPVPSLSWLSSPLFCSLWSIFWVSLPLMTGLCRVPGSHSEAHPPQAQTPTFSRHSSIFPTRNVWLFWLNKTLWYRMCNEIPRSTEYWSVHGIGMIMTVQLLHGNKHVLNDSASEEIIIVCGEPSNNKQRICGEWFTQIFSLMPRIFSKIIYWCGLIL